MRAACTSHRCYSETRQRRESTPPPRPGMEIEDAGCSTRSARERAIQTSGKILTTRMRASHATPRKKKMRHLIHSLADSAGAALMLCTCTALWQITSDWLGGAPMRRVDQAVSEREVLATTRVYLGEPKRSRIRYARDYRDLKMFPFKRFSPSRGCMFLSS